MRQKHSRWTGGLPIMLAALATGLGPAHAASPQERVALMFPGEGCAVARNTVHERLSAGAGVIRVDWSILPDHVMIDRAPDGLTAEDLVKMVNDLVSPAGQCRAEIMKSCITAEAGVHRPEVAR